MAVKLRNIIGTYFLFVVHILTLVKRLPGSIIKAKDC